MLDVPKASFSYLAFNKRSQGLLAYGLTAESAQEWAAELAPGAPLKVVPAGQFGRTMWNRKFTLKQAQRALQKACALA